ncbi:antibiotic biosynthesis monooxygenase family protein [Variovorax sp. SG517]|uniref:antibiotic biosynthesis monooxygenase family protein n=1 Tax=unclassified Variovorax TaxID=663243 RepID=UPI00159E3A71|nr:antibiotic biosynthesis monooxygenase family protein [Variovorax sp. SG517]NVM88015.1 quinol monooxygenase YgiN [Variovorax sp. SG517]
MSNNATVSASGPVFRVDKFVVPAGVRAEFIAQMRRIQQTLRALPGCLRAHVLDQTGGNGEFNVLTLVEWADEQAVASAAEFVKKKFAEEGFDPVAFTSNAGVRPDQGFYRIA